MAERKGSSGRIPDSKRPTHKLFQKVNISIDPETFDRLEVYCAEQERARSWAIQKALDLWLTEQGYQAYWVVLVVIGATQKRPLRQLCVIALKDGKSY